RLRPTLFPYTTLFRSQAFMDHLDGQGCRHVLHVVRRTHRVHVDGDDVEAAEATEKFQAFSREQPAPARRRDTRRAGWVEHVHVEDRKSTRLNSSHRTI